MMKITEQFAKSILNGFETGKTGQQVALGVTSPLWFTGLVVAGTLEGVFDVAKGAVDAVGKVAGMAGEVTWDKIQKLKEVRGTTPVGEIRVKFEGKTYDVDSAIARLEELFETDKKEKAKILYDKTSEAIEIAQK